MTSERPMTDREMTVVEYASKHCAENNELSAQKVQAHVNLMILTAITMNRALWSVVVDTDGRASLVFVSLPEPTWDGLLAASTTTRALIDLLRDTR